MVSRLLLFLFLTSFYSQAQFWTERSSGFPITSTGLSKIHIVDDNVAWATGYDGLNPNNNIQRFSTTSDGGMTWSASTVDIGNSALGISNISGVSATTAYIAVHPRASGQIGGVWQTTDTGATWTRQTGAAFNSTSSFANAVHFFNTTDGVAIGDPAGGYWEIYTTTNGGTSYARVPSSNIPAPLTNEVGYLAQYTHLGNNIWFTTSAGRVYHSANMGNNWSVFNTPLSDFGGTNLSGDITFSTPNKGMIQDNSGNLFITQDAGTTWNPVNISGTGFPYGGAIAYIPNSSRVVSTGGDTALAGTAYSTDDGITWTNVSTDQHVDVAFLDEDTGYSGGFSTISTQDGVYVYTDSVLSTYDQLATDGFSIYPNPSSEFINILSTQPIEKVEIYDINSRLLMEYSNISLIDVTDLQSGIYFIKVNANTTSTTQQLIKN
ncbi:T9SS type A sorting domain-containing protein [Nonlabens ulvanivorans]|uniref:Glycosyl transferase n=1 Tax=Nonlabens ulvanivorans TaxID=906888 RepID=A0A084JU66_NONUL|nr:T9SS type A sorting domain-containing protein [Nonlabens ulvanivorans]KEZ92500.1 glycosyl transferase [Nonlabens ulvanivorans]PRX15338.1 putative secreted protein (Por secretion system target) [Nonlabens ulvanivorans]